MKSFFEIEMKTGFFQSCGHWWVSQICCHVECSTLTASSLRILNSWAGILSLERDISKGNICNFFSVWYPQLTHAKVCKQKLTKCRLSDKQWWALNTTCKSVAVKGVGSRAVPLYFPNNSELKTRLLFQNPEGGVSWKCSLMPRVQSERLNGRI